MAKITYNTKLIFKDESDKKKLVDVLNAQMYVWNECSKMKFNHNLKNSLPELHGRFYQSFRQKQPEIPSQIIITAENSVLASYRSIKSNKHKISNPLEKKNPSVRLDKRIYSYKGDVFSIISLEKRVKCSPHFYPKLRELFSKYKFCDPLIFLKNGEVWIAFTFDIPETLPQNKLAIGVDLGCRVNAATSEGILYVDKGFNQRKRQLRYLKRKLQSKGKDSKSAKRKLRRLRRKERNINHNFSHNLAKCIIKDTKADTIVLENLKSIKVKKHKYQNKNRISQVPLFELRRILTYKALLNNKQVITVSPAYTSQIDHRTGKRDGGRVGARYIGKDGQILHADVNAACNIALRSKHPSSIRNYFAWQVVVNQPIVCKSCAEKSVEVLQALSFKAG